MDSLGNSRRSSACSSVLSQEELESYGLDEEQMRNLKRTFDQFDSDKSGALKIDTVHTILKMMGYKVSAHGLQVSKYNANTWYTCSIGTYSNNGLFEKKQEGRCETFLNRVMQIPKRKMVAIIHLDESASSFFRHDKSVACSRRHPLLLYIVVGISYMNIEIKIF